MTASAGRDRLRASDVQVLPATGRFEDVAAVVGPRRPGAPACWCLAHRLRTAEITEEGRDVREWTMRALCADDHPGSPPGLLAYVDGEPAGWVGCGPRREMSYVQHSRRLVRVHDDDVWVVICVRVLPPFRRRGLTALLPAAALDAAAAAGADAVEAYPVDPSGGRVDQSMAYVGLTGWFEAAGFTRLQETGATSGGRRRWLVRRELWTGAPPAGVDRIP
ncbi:GNAT family N-acetyltransferase [Serinicoccus sp. LYQ131]|uniref:GNAT family N-acetyltransferase n=1 Tax=Serinicoccus sp. LYQ131 TaxID=3378797 RepID=UPI00385466DF